MAPKSANDDEIVAEKTAAEFERQLEPKVKKPSYEDVKAKHERIIVNTHGKLLNEVACALDDLGIPRVGFTPVERVWLLAKRVEEVKLEWERSIMLPTPSYLNQRCTLRQLAWKACRWLLGPLWKR